MVLLCNSFVLTLKALGFFLPVQYWGCVFHPLWKIRSKHPRELKLTGLIAYIMFYKICKFESSTIRNDVITKTRQNSDIHETKQIIYQLKDIDKSYPKMYFLLNLSHYVKSYGHFCQILAFLRYPAHQIWSCYVIQEANFDTFILS